MRVQIKCDDPPLTVQGFKDQCDLRKLMQRFGRVADFAEYVKSQNLARSGRFGDFSSVPDYRVALDMIREADAKFTALPAIVRERFRDDPATFLDFCSDPKNLDEMRKLGLANPLPVEKPPSPGG